MFLGQENSSRAPFETSPIDRSDLTPTPLSRARSVSNLQPSSRKDKRALRECDDSALTRIYPSVFLSRLGGFGTFLPRFRSPRPPRRRSPPPIHPVFAPVDNSVTTSRADRFRRVDNTVEFRLNDVLISGRCNQLLPVEFTSYMRTCIRPRTKNQRLWSE